MKNKIILNCMPPYNIYSPNPAFSALKTFLLQNDYSVKIIYWNLIFYELLRDLKEGIETLKFYKMGLINLIPFLSYITFNEKDSTSSENIELFLLSKFPFFKEIKKIKYNNDFLGSISKEINYIIYKYLDNFDFSKTILFGISARYNQWIPGSILVDLLKKKYPTIKTILGGFGNKEEALVLMRKYKKYDYAIWGEAEDSLLKLCNNISNLNEATNLKNIPNLIFRINKKLFISKKINKSYIDLNIYNINNYDDFFQQINSTINIKEIKLPIETGRGCHWNKCKFCFLNIGYKYRKKSPGSIISGINYLYQKYNIVNYELIDNDVIGNDIEYFKILLNLLFEFNKKIGFKLNILLAEFNSNALSSNILRKMSLVGFKKIQIGYEAISDNLLKKINKKSNFSNHLLTIKYAQKYNINIVSANIITNLICETNKDIIESIDNLNFLRFYLGNKYFTNNIIELVISASSKFFNIINEEEKIFWTENEIKRFLPKNYFKFEDEFKILNFKKSIRNHMWDYFEEIDDNYKKLKYSYSLIKNDKKVIYEEYCNKKIIKRIIFSELYWEILKATNNTILSINQIQNCLEKNKLTLSLSNLKSIIKQLIDKYILYSNSDFSSIITVIDTDKLL